MQQLQDKMKAFQIMTNDPRQIIWGNESKMQGTGVNL